MLLLRTMSRGSVVCLNLRTTKTVVYIYRCSGVMGKYAAGELKPPTIGEFNNSMLIDITEKSDQ